MVLEVVAIVQTQLQMQIKNHPIEKRMQAASITCTESLGGKN